MVASRRQLLLSQLKNNLAIASKVIGIESNINECQKDSGLSSLQRKSEHDHKSANVDLRTSGLNLYGPPPIPSDPLFHRNSARPEQRNQSSYNDGIPNFDDRYPMPLTRDSQMSASNFEQQGSNYRKSVKPEYYEREGMQRDYAPPSNRSDLGDAVEQILKSMGVNSNLTKMLQDVLKKDAGQMLQGPPRKEIPTAEQLEREEWERNTQSFLAKLQETSPLIETEMGLPRRDVSVTTTSKNDPGKRDQILKTLAEMDSNIKILQDVMKNLIEMRMSMMSRPPGAQRDNLILENGRMQGEIADQIDTMVKASQELADKLREEEANASRSNFVDVAKHYLPVQESITRPPSHVLPSRDDDRSNSNRNIARPPSHDGDKSNSNRNIPRPPSHTLSSHYDDKSNSSKNVSQHLMQIKDNYRSHSRSRSRGRDTLRSSRQRRSRSRSRRSRSRSRHSRRRRSQSRHRGRRSRSRSYSRGSSRSYSKGRSNSKNRHRRSDGSGMRMLDIPRRIQDAKDKLLNAKKKKVPTATLR